MKNFRIEQIKKYVEEKEMITIAQLTKMFPDVSLMTIHRDLNFLEQQGVIHKIRGGAMAAGNLKMMEPTLDYRTIENMPDKEIVAKKAVDFLGEEGSIYIDSGSTAGQIARFLPDKSMNIITSSPLIALELAKKEKPSSMLCGGLLNRRSMSLSGSSGIHMLSKINIDVAFLVASGFSLTGGFTCGKESEADIKELLVKRARTVVLLMDHSKIGRILPFNFANLQDIHYLITDRPLPQEIYEAVTAAGAEVI